MSGLTQTPRTVGVLGGGTAGYFTALAFQRYIPGVRVEVIAPHDIPPIGVGESTVPKIVGFVHDYLGLAVDEFYKEVQPTWKLGARFVWGLPGDYWFHFPFEKIDHGAAHSCGFDVRRGALRSVLMDTEKSFVLPAAPSHNAYATIIRKDYSYHLDNRKLIAYLRRRVEHAGIRLLDAQIQEIETDERRERIRCLRGAGGGSFTYDLYVDCSGFRSLLLKGALGVPFVDYSRSLFTNAAIIGDLPNAGHIKPYTTCYAMDCGWTWIIPMRNEDHLGYVFSAAHCTADKAAAELKSKLGVTAHPHVIRFPSGRYEEVWKGNVLAVGNAAGFVEPLQSTGIQMITIAIQHAIDAVLKEDRRAAVRQYNEAMRAKWDFLRAFIALHYRFNKRLDTPFWQDCRQNVDLAGIESLIAYFHERGLLSLAAPETRDGFKFLWDAGLFGTNGIDIMLLGQGERPPAGSVSKDRARVEGYSRKRTIWELISQRALPQKDALRVIEGRFDLLRR